VDPQGAFSIRYPDQYTADSTYQYTALGPGKSIRGVKFIIPQSLSKGTNLAQDSYVSVEVLPEGNHARKQCSASEFLEGNVPAREATDGDMAYSLASSTGAAAGNRYEETVYAIMDANVCMAVRYFIHYGVIDNYPSGTVQEFDKAALLQQFDAIRRSLVIGQ
jgi:hypothetical protein